MSLSASHHHSFSGIQNSTHSNIGKQERKPSTRKRRDRSGTRCVAALNSAQLARKRANDREAQRATRQRIKEHIERLESRIRQLSDGSSSDRELDELQQRNYELEKELACLQDSMASRNSVIAQWESIKAAWNGSPALHYSLPTIESPAPPFSSASQATPPTMLATASYPQTSWQPSWSPPIYEESYGKSPTSETSSCGTVNTVFGDKISNTLMNTQFAAPWATVEGCNPLQPVPSAMYPGHNSGNLSSSYVAPNGSTAPAFSCGGLPAPTLSCSPKISPVVEGTDPTQPSANQRLQNAWTLPLRLSNSNGPFDVIIFEVIQRQRNVNVAFTDEAAIMGPNRPSVKPLLYPEQRNESHPISSVIASVLHKTALTDLPEKAAALYLMYKLAQWQILPTCDSYHALPEWFTPRISQLLTQHPMWVSQIPWGKLRDKVIENQADYATEEFQYLYLRSLNINWTCPTVDAFIWSPGGDDVTIRESFEDHVRTLANWSLDEPFSQRYPELRDYCRFTSDGVQASIQGSCGRPRDS